MKFEKNAGYDMISVRVDKKLKKTMQGIKNVNWSEVIRSAIRMEVENRNRNLAKALLLNEKNVIKPEKNFNSTEMIKKWRLSRTHQW